MNMSNLLARNDDFPSPDSKAIFSGSPAALALLEEAEVQAQVRRSLTPFILCADDMLPLKDWNDFGPILRACVRQLWPEEF